MFSKVESTLKWTGVIIFWLGLLVSVILFIAGISIGKEISNDEVKGMIFLTYFIYAICTFAGSFILSIILYGIGESVELQKNGINEKQLEIIMENNANLTELEEKVLDVIKAEIAKEGEMNNGNLYFGEKRTQALVDVAGSSLDDILLLLERKGVISCAGIGKRPLGYIAIN